MSSSDPDPSLLWLPSSEFTRALDVLTDVVDRCRVFSAMSRINTLYMIARAGSGHLGSSFSAADIVSWMLLQQLRDPFTSDGDVYFSSKGHDVPGLYAALIGLGLLPEEQVHRLRRLDGLPGHPDVRTPHMAANTGSLGMGISKAKGMILGDRLTGRSRQIYVLTGDGELQEGQNWEALAGAAHRGMGELTVVVDHNKIQSDTWVRDVSDLGDLVAKFESFGWGAIRCDGHDFSSLDEAFAVRAARYPGRPVAVVADTVKGAGCSGLAATSMPPGEWRYRFHSGAPPADVYRRAHDELVAGADELLAAHGLAALSPRAGGTPPPARRGSRPLPAAYGEALVDHAQTDQRIVALDADLVLDTGLITFSERFGDRFVECGIAEQDMVSMAGGLAGRGLLPFVHSFSCFLHSRANEQIYNNATEGRKVIYVGSLAGVLPAGPGHSHQAVRDVSSLAAVPDLVILEPANEAQVRAALRFCLRTEASVYLRLVSLPVPAEVVALPSADLALGQGTWIRPGSRVVALGAGPVVLTQLLRAADLLAAQGVDLAVMNFPWHNRVDPDWLAALAQDADHLLVVENHYTVGGQADLLARAVLELALPVGFHAVGVRELPGCGGDEEILDLHGLSARKLAGTVLTMTAQDRSPADAHANS